jgi:hypothetical protein
MKVSPNQSSYNGTTNQSQNIEHSLSHTYIPSDYEKKRVFLLYILIGFLVVSYNEESPQ